MFVGAFLRACARRWQLNAVSSVTSHDASVPPPHSARVQASADDGCSLGQGVASRARQARELPRNIEFKHGRMKFSAPTKFIKNGVWSVAVKTRLFQLFMKQQQHMINKIMTQLAQVD